MGVNVSIKVEDTHSWYVEEQNQFDMHCPLMNGAYDRLNYWKKNCLKRQNDHENKPPDCYGGCKAHNRMCAITEEKNPQFFIELAHHMRNKINPTAIGKLMGVSRSTIVRYIRKIEEL
jgi:hypothetical protein